MMTRARNKDIRIGVVIDKLRFNFQLAVVRNVGAHGITLRAEVSFTIVHIGDQGITQHIELTI